MTFTEIDKLYKEKLTEKEQKKIRALENKISDMEKRFAKERLSFQNKYIELHDRVNGLLLENKKLKED